MLRTHVIGSRKFVAIVVMLAVTALAGVIACTSEASDEIEVAWPRGVTGSIPGVTGDLGMLLSDKGPGATMFRAQGRAEGDGIIEGTLYSMWLSDQKGKALRLDIAHADEECEVDSDTGEESDECEVEVSLRSNLTQAPFGVASVSGLTLTIREGLGTDRTAGTVALNIADLNSRVVLEFTVSESDLL